MVNIFSNFNIVIASNIAINQNELFFTFVKSGHSFKLPDGVVGVEDSGVPRFLSRKFRFRLHPNLDDVGRLRSENGQCSGCRSGSDPDKQKSGSG